MTRVGKFLVCLNLIFSVAVGAFIVMIYVARAHWVEEFQKLEKRNTVLAADARTFQSELQKAQADAAAQIAKKNDELKNAQQDLEAANRTISQLRKDLGEAQTKSQHETALSSIYTSEVGKRQEDVGQLRATLQSERAKNNELVKQNADLRDQATVAQIERRTVQEQNGRMEKQLQQMAKDLARMRASGASATMARAGGKNPPPENVEGLVKNTDSRDGVVLMTLTIGSDAGLAKGHTLELFRINTASPSQSKYLGTVRILEAEAHQAVAQPVGRLSSPPQRGDRVSSRILGG
jgi:myosin heavy subunit